MTMSAGVLIGDGEAARLVSHPLRAAILGEVHARPFTPLSVPSRVIHFGFDTSSTRAQADRANLVAFCASRGLPAPLPAEKHHRAPFGTTVLRWEQHSEFTTYTWELPSDPGTAPFHTYYAVSLFGYLAKAAHDSGKLDIEPSIVTAAFVPVAALSIWWTIRHIRKRHVVGED
jgi:uncharacterized membrane-anchored protein